MEQLDMFLYVISSVSLDACFQESFVDPEVLISLVVAVCDLLLSS